MFLAAEKEGITDFENEDSYRTIEEALENDEISSEEAAFMIGFEEA